MIMGLYKYFTTCNNSFHCMKYKYIAKDVLIKFMDMVTAIQPCILTA